MKSTEPLCVLLADDHNLFAEALVAMLKARWPFAQVDLATDFSELMIRLRTAKAYDLVISDIRMPGMIGASKTSEIVQACNSAKLVLISGDAQALDIAQALTDGASGFIHKSQTGADLISAIERILHQPPMDAAARELANEAAGVNTWFSRRELQTMELLIDGTSNKNIAALLGISPSTVKVYVTSLMKKTGAHTRTEIAVFGLRNGMSGGRRQDV